MLWGLESKLVTKVVNIINYISLIFHSRIVKFFPTLNSSISLSTKPIHIQSNSELFKNLICHLPPKQFHTYLTAISQHRPTNPHRRPQPVASDTRIAPVSSARAGALLFPYIHIHSVLGTAVIPRRELYLSLG